MGKKCYKVKAHVRKGKPVSEHIRCVDKKSNKLSREESLTYKDYLEKFNKYKKDGEFPASATPEDFLKLAGVGDDDNIQDIKFNASFDLVNISIKTDKYYVSRSYDYEKMSIKNSIFEVFNKGNGTGLEVFNRQVKEAQNKNFKKIDTFAAKYLNGEPANGYYTWARMGYSPEKGWLEKFNSYSPKYKGIKDFETLFKTDGGLEYWNKEGMAFDGSFDLSPNSESIRLLNNYTKSKNGR
jgi:hypothetical protein